jgi:hypothetical protein
VQVRGPGRAARPRGLSHTDDFLDTFLFRPNLNSKTMATSSNSKTSKAKPAKPAAAAPAVKATAKPAPAVKARASASSGPTQEEIQTRAYELYLSEGCKDGNDLEYWLRAEQELRARG